LALFTHRKILVQELSVDDIEKEIINYLNAHNFKQISFSEYLKEVDELKLSQQYIVTCFSALLELVKYRQINLTQNDMDDDILIAKNMQKDEMQDALLGK
jgi:chromatin segregation and condensation protein Rec8/ScpA/Scc1 (kleisin family)